MAAPDDRPLRDGTSRNHPLFEKVGMPSALRWGYLGLLLFMTGNGTETNFISTHMNAMFGGNAAIFVQNVIALYGISVIIAAYLGGVLSDLFGPRRVMTAGFIIWVVFEVLFLISMGKGYEYLTLLTYFFRGFGFPLFAFGFLVWINDTADDDRLGAAVGWFYVVFTGGMPTVGALIAFFTIPLFGGGTHGETMTLWLSIILVVLGFLCIQLKVRLHNADKRTAPANESNLYVITSGLRLCKREPRVLIGFLIRLVNTAPQFGMLIIMPGVIGHDLGWGESKWMMMTVIVFSGNILLNAVFGNIGDRWGWLRTVRTFGLGGAAVGLLLWWYVAHWVTPGSLWGYWVTIAAGLVFSILMAGFVPMGAIMSELAPKGERGSAMAMYGAAAGGAAFLGPLVVAVIKPFAGNPGVVWTFVILYVIAFLVSKKVAVDQPKYRPAKKQK